MESLLIILANVDKSAAMDSGTGAIFSLVAILLVFAILGIIIGITTLVFKLTGLFEMKKQVEAKAIALNNNTTVSEAKSNEPVEIKDDDMMAAVLVATIDYRKEINKDVRVVSVKEVK